MGSSSSLTLKDKLNYLLNPHQQGQSQSSFSSNSAMIQKVPPYLRERSDFYKFYSPKMVSIGPIHHPKGEEYKKAWASTYLKSKGGGQQDVQRLLDKIQNEIKELKGLFAEDVIQEWWEEVEDDDDDDDELAWMLFIDGCAALHIMRKAVNNNEEESPLQALDIIVQQDLLLLENQLPCKVLMILSNEDDSVLRRFIDHILRSRNIVPQVHQVINQQPAHLLDMLLKCMLNEHTVIDGMPTNKVRSTHRNIQELVASGIKIKRNERANLTSISFSGGTLYIPPFKVDDFTVQIFQNMKAYEMRPDSKSKYEISNYISFLNSLIDHADDVKTLRKADVLTNHLGSDEEVAKIFNTVITDLVLDTGIYEQVKQEIEELYKQKCRTWLKDLLNVKNWLVEFHHKHFNTPWKIIGLISFILGFVLTVVNLKKELDQKKD